MTGRRCLVTGGAGFIGSHLVEALLNGGWEVRVLDCQSGPDSNLARVRDRLEFVEGDFGDKAILPAALEGVQIVFHYASTTSPATAHGQSEMDVGTNLVGTLHLLDEMIRRGAASLVYPSSGGTIYGPVLETPITESHPTNPVCSHGIVKLAVEKYIQLYHQEHGLDYIILRYGNPYGPRQRPGGKQGAVAVFTKKILTGQPIEIWGDGRIVRDFIYIDDLVEATLKAPDSGNAWNSVINIGSSVGTSVNELVSLIEAAAGRKAAISYRPLRRFDVPVSVLAIGRARDLLKWRPRTSLADGLRKTVAWIEEFMAGAPG
ncbi:MAG: NAD-dependent epimerase/dehydratase family protein [Acidobacteriota bacterium]|nr:NAD-dependent epimerase/dehydratase family protein [Acidobacteriota bacterium]